MKRPTNEELSRTLLDSFAEDEVPAKSRERAFAAFGIAAGVTSATTAVTAAGEIAGQLTPAVTIAKSAVAVGGLSLVKAVATGAAIGAVVMFAGERAIEPRAPASTPSAMHVAAPSPAHGDRNVTLTPSPSVVAPFAETNPAVASANPEPPAVTVQAVAPPAPVATSRGEVVYRAPSPPLANVAEGAPLVNPPPVAPQDPSTATLTGEVARLDRARTALREGDPARALRELGGYDAEFPTGNLRQEATVLRIESLVQTGDEPRARALAEAFAQAHPRSGYLHKIRELLVRSGKTPAP